MSSEALSQRQNLADLQSASLRLMCLFVAPIGYLWWFAAVWPIGEPAPPYRAWIGALALFLGALLSYALRRRHLLLASCVLLAGTLLGILAGMVAGRMPLVACLFSVPVIFSSVLLSQGAVFLVAGLSCLLTGVVSVGMFGLPATSADVLLPMAVTVAVSMASWLSARNLYIALDWVWSGYERAHQNEQIARRGQAELRRALKASDEAAYRLERVNRQLAIARDQAEEARRLKQQFAQTISHELRTPLNLIVGFAELMIESPEYYGGSLSPAHLHDLGVIHRNARHLQKLVNDVLDLARIEAAQMGLLLEETDPAALLQEAVNTVRSLVESRGLALHTEVAPGLPHLWLDPTRIRQVLFNLLNNAARFTERGSITVRLSGDAQEVIFAVADTGVGIAPEDAARIFQEFQQVDGGTRRRHEGAGLGLAISRRFVELHGGRIWLESRPGEGSTFYFSLPVEGRGAAVSLLPSGAAVARPAAAPADERVLLIVTRSPSAAALLTRHLTACRTIVVQDLEQAARAAAQALPQGVVIDTSGRGCEPADLADLARAWGLPRVPLMACPLPGEEHLRQRLAVQGYLAKPVTRQGLWDALRRFGEGIDRVLIVDDDPDFVQLLTRLLDDRVRRYEAIAAYTGQHALQLIESRQPDLLLLDLSLPDIDGLQVIERVRGNPRCRELPIVVVSAQEDMDTLEALASDIHVARAQGFRTGEVLQWIQHMLDGNHIASGPAGADGHLREPGPAVRAA